MNYILCNDSQNKFWREVISATSVTANDVRVVTSNQQLEREFSQIRHSPLWILIEAALRWHDGHLQKFYGFDVAQLLRRRYLVRCPIVVIGTVDERFLATAEVTGLARGFVNAAGADFLSFPFSKHFLCDRLAATKFLSKAELHDLVVGHCGLKEEWRHISHKLAGYLSNRDLEARKKEIAALLNRWEDSIARFAPSTLADFKKFRARFSKFSITKNAHRLKESLQRLDESLQGITPSSMTDVKTPKEPPRHPPKGFRKILIADDEPQNFLINSLRNQYGYQVVEQGFKLSQARELLLKEKPDVVLSDLFFKESTRSSEVPDKSVGDRFIHDALTHNQYRNSNLRKPIVLVTSKATLRTETDIRAGAINCSGASRATNPAFIHKLIWTEAKKRGVIDSEDAAPGNWNIEHRWRQKLQQYETDLSRLITKWQSFPVTVSETVRLLEMFAKSKGNDDPDLIEEVIRILGRYTSVPSFSMRTAKSLFKDMERIRITARAARDTNSSRQMLNILHSKIEQCSSLVNGVISFVAVLKEVAEEMVAVPRFRHLQSALEDFSTSKPLLSFLKERETIVHDLILNLPEVPRETASGVPSVRRNVRSINIVVVEDDDFWQSFVAAAIEKVRLRLGQSVEISTQYFDNVQEALKVIPYYNKNFAITKRNDRDKETLVIADLCLPESREQAEKIRAFSNATNTEFHVPHSVHGLNLIRQLSRYEYDVPVILLSTVHAMADRSVIGSWGVADHDFLAKGIDDEDTLVRAVIRRVEKKTKYVVQKIQNKEGISKFTVNGIEIPLSRNLARTLLALVDLHQTRSERSFSVSQIMESRGNSSSIQSRKIIHNHISRIRKIIFNTLQRNGVYVNVREMLQTEKSVLADDFLYKLDAEIIRVEDELIYEDYVRECQRNQCKVLIVENDLAMQAEIATALAHLTYEVVVANNVHDAIQIATESSPHIVSLDLSIPYSKTRELDQEEFAGLEAWEQIQLTLPTSTVGIVILTEDVANDYLLAKAAQMEIPIRNFVSRREPHWLNLFLKKIGDEKRRVFLGEVADPSSDVCEPIIEILNESDLQAGILKLVVNGQPFSMRVSPIATVMGLLVSNPKRRLTFSEIKTASGSTGPVTKDDSKNWTKRIRSLIQEKWLTGYDETKARSLTKKILQSSNNGLQLNAHVIDLRTH